MIGGNNSYLDISMTEYLSDLEDQVNQIDEVS